MDQDNNNIVRLLQRHEPLLLDDFEEVVTYLTEKRGYSFSYTRIHRCGKCSMRYVHVHYENQCFYRSRRIHRYKNLKLGGDTEHHGETETNWAVQSQDQCNGFSGDEGDADAYDLLESLQDIIDLDDNNENVP